MTAQPQNQGSNVVHLATGIPDFEGQPVEIVEFQISGMSTVTAEGLPVAGLDDRVRLVGAFRVVGVRHVVDDKTATVKRIQMMKPISVETCPWDPGDPQDDGVIRARG